MLHIIILCGSEDSGKKKILTRIDKALSAKKDGKSIHVNGRSIPGLSPFLGRGRSAA